MRCPIDETVLMITDRSGIEIDFCPTCRGVWLDRGELDKIIERSAADVPRSRRDDDDDDDDRRRDSREHRDDVRYDMPKKKKKSSMLSELFDF